MSGYLDGVAAKSLSGREVETLVKIADCLSSHPVFNTKSTDLLEKVLGTLLSVPCLSKDVFERGSANVSADLYLAICERHPEILESAVIDLVEKVSNRDDNAAAAPETKLVSIYR